MRPGTFIGWSCRADLGLYTKNITRILSGSHSRVLEHIEKSRHSCMAALQSLQGSRQESCSSGYDAPIGKKRRAEQTSAGGHNGNGRAYTTRRAEDCCGSGDRCRGAAYTRCPGGGEGGP